ncbi:uncharacterized protein BDCG_01384 [Blastomyces dermatitidis ER-3]|uniref:Uncharacterized protein n=1 Tax=Ajellomyces dermatitidis (strain ER-3 / ATCC MYA-2586) TaxID=559297 RepID=A0ABP2EV41_AJEDR|nr:uncharacterized protein BDCG_01384 [Blastomyces dermatitidis ER-3]EEQ86264.1 hypothetical protein BDCG_01384 [Blastomyces dermatitidis ER-3]
MLQRLLTHGDSHNNKKELLSLLKDICSDASALCVEDSTRKLAGPPLLNHFNDVTDLDVKLGLNEELNDRNMPQFWSRKQLLLAASVSIAIDAFIRMLLTFADMAIGNCKRVNTRSANREWVSLRERGS